jgi:hypothetical protein
MTVADNILNFISGLDFKGTLPPGIRIMNPYKDEKIRKIAMQFYRKFYDDSHPRQLILGINPGRFGAGVTGIPFTDTKRLYANCGIRFPGKETHEPSSVFVYRVIDAYGGAEAFYRNFFIGAVCPLGFTRISETGKEINYNYYDDAFLMQAAYPFILMNLKRQIDFGITRDKCFCLGTGKNFRFLKQLNNEHGFFKSVIPLDHPRFIMQYKLTHIERYVRKYIEAFTSD